MSRAKKIRRTILYIAGYLLIASIIALTVFFFVTSAGSNVAFIFDKSIMWVKTPSMYPEIPENTFIYIEKTNTADIEVGDIIVFVSDDPEIVGMYNTHRVTEIIGDGEEFVTKGDNNTVEDYYNAKAKNVIGKYIMTLPFLSSVGRVLSGKIGIIIFATAIFGILMAMYVPVMSRYKKDTSGTVAKEKEKLMDELVKAEIERLKAERLNDSKINTEISNQEIKEKDGSEK